MDKQRTASELYAKAFSSAPLAIAISTIADDRYVEVNSAFEQLCGYTREEVINHSTKELNLWADPEERDRIMNDLHVHGHGHDIEIKLKDKSAGIKICAYSAELLDINGEPCLISFINDITSRKRVAEQIEILDTRLAARAFELEIANEELETFSYTVSHDLRKPLTTINAYCQVITELCTCLDPPCRGYVQEIYDNTMKMNALIDTLLDFSRMSQSEVHRGNVDLSAIALAVATELKQAEPERRVTLTIAEGVTGSCDAGLLRVVLANLIGNAWKYTLKQDLVSIEFGVTETKAGKVYFLKDNGPGFDMTHAKKLFIPFQRLPGAANIKGFGIGLATVQRIIQRHGGRVWAEGEPGKGATFYFTLE